MEIYASILYSLRFRRPFLNFMGTPRLALELVGVVLCSELGNLSLFNSGYKMPANADPGVSDLVPPVWHINWKPYQEIVDRIGAYLDGADLSRGVTVITGGDPHEVAMMARILSETKRGMAVRYRSLEQLKEDAMQWLPVRCYGIGSNFLRFIHRDEGVPFDDDDRAYMFASHVDYPYNDQEIHLIDRAHHLRTAYSAINSIMTGELNAEPREEESDEYKNESYV